MRRSRDLRRGACAGCASAVAGVAGRARAHEDPRDRYRERALLGGAVARRRALISARVSTARDHARLLLPMIDELLARGRHRAALTRCDRLRPRARLVHRAADGAASVAQGLALGAGLPVSARLGPACPGRTGARGAAPAACAPAPVVACMDARMAEVYWACFRGGGRRARRPARSWRVGPGREPPGCAARPGLRQRRAGPVCGLSRTWRGSCGSPAARCWRPGARRRRCRPAGRRRPRGGCRQVAAEAAQPVYLRDNVANVQRNNRRCKMPVTCLS